MVTQDVNYAVHDGQLFTVTCPKNDDKSFATLFKIIKEFIDREIGKAPEVFEVNLTASTLTRFQIANSSIVRAPKSQE